MSKVEQGDLLRLSGLPFPVMVVSNNYFNDSGKAIVCPILKQTAASPLHIELKDCPVEGYVICEQVKYVDLSSKRFTKLSGTQYYDTMNISDAVMGIFDYQIF